MSILTSCSSLLLTILNDRSRNKSITMLGNDMKTNAVPIRVSLTTDALSRCCATSSLLKLEQIRKSLGTSEHTYLSLWFCLLGTELVKCSNTQVVSLI